MHACFREEDTYYTYSSVVFILSYCLEEEATCPSNIIPHLLAGTVVYDLLIPGKTEGLGGGQEGGGGEGTYSTCLPCNQQRRRPGALLLCLPVLGRRRETSFTCVWVWLQFSACVMPQPCLPYCVPLPVPSCHTCNYAACLMYVYSGTDMPCIVDMGSVPACVTFPCYFSLHRAAEWDHASFSSFTPCARTPFCYKRRTYMHGGCELLEKAWEGRGLHAFKHLLTLPMFHFCCTIHAFSSLLLSLFFSSVCFSFYWLSHVYSCQLSIPYHIFSCTFYTHTYNNIYSACYTILSLSLSPPSSLKTCFF